jgi:hypothetical protein
MYRSIFTNEDILKGLSGIIWKKAVESVSETWQPFGLLREEKVAKFLNISFLKCSNCTKKN